MIYGQSRAEQRRKVLALMAKVQKRSKYRAVRCEVDGEKFDSQKEAARWGELNLLRRSGDVRNLRRQIAFELTANGERIGVYVADFVYEVSNMGYGGVKWTLVIEDVKGGEATKTALWRWKVKHFKAQYGRDIKVV